MYVSVKGEDDTLCGVLVRVLLHAVVIFMNRKCATETLCVAGGDDREAVSCRGCELPVETTEKLRVAGVDVKGGCLPIVGGLLGFQFAQDRF